MTSRRQFLWRLTGAVIFAPAVAPGVPWPEPSVDATLYQATVDERFAASDLPFRDGAPQRGPLWAEVSNEYAVIGERDARHLRWRYAAASGESHGIFGL